MTKRAARGDWRDGTSGEGEDRDDDVTVGRLFDCLRMLGSQAVASRIWYHRRQCIPVTETMLDRSGPGARAPGSRLIVLDNAMPIVRLHGM